MAIQQRASTMLTKLQALADKLVSPTQRQQYWNQTTAFAQDQPLLFTFALAQLLLLTTPLLLFLSFTLGTLLFSLCAALVFTFFWTGVALLVLIPCLFFSVGTAIVLWVWGLCAFVVGRWVYVSLLGGRREALVFNGKGGKGGVDVKKDVNGDY